MLLPDGESTWFVNFSFSARKTLQTSCRLRNFSIISVLALTVSNVFLTLRLLQVSDCGHYNDHLATSLIPKAPVILTPATTCLEYVLADSSVNATDRPVFSGLELKLGRWDTRRMFKVFDFAVVGEKFVELSDKLNVTLATQSSIEKIFSLVQGEQIHYFKGEFEAFEIEKIIRLWWFSWKFKQRDEMDHWSSDDKKFQKTFLENCIAGDFRWKVLNRESFKRSCFQNKFSLKVSKKYLKETQMILFYVMSFFKS